MSIYIISRIRQLLDGSSCRPGRKFAEMSVIRRASGKADASVKSQNRIHLFPMVGWMFMIIERMMQIEQNSFSAVN